MALWLALLLAAWGAAVGMAGAVTGRADLSESGERGVHAASLFTALSIIGLAYALAVGDLTYRYVASWTSSFIPLPYRLGAVWAGPSGSLLVWALAIGLGTSVAAASLPRRGSLRSWTAALLALLLLAVLAMACFDTNPFARLAFSPNDGRGIALEWMRPLVLAQMPMGYLAMGLVSVPAVITVMGALGADSWRGAAQRSALVCWALLGGAMLLDWRRSYGVSEWIDDWRWAPVHAGTAFAWAGATLLVAASHWRVRVGTTIVAGFAAFALALGGLTLRRAAGWEGVHAFAQSASGSATGWVLLGATLLAVAAGVHRARTQSAQDIGARAAFAAQLSVAAVAAALVAAGLPRVTDVALAEGARATVADRFGTEWTLSLEGVSAVGRADVVSSVVAFRATVNGRVRAFVVPELRELYAGASGRPVEELGVAGIAPGLAQDFRVDLRETSTAGAVATVRFIPAASWIWIAGALAVLAALVLAVIPSSTAAPETSSDGASNSASDLIAGPAPELDPRRARLEGNEDAE